MACTALFASASVVAQDIVYLPAPAPVAGMQAPACFQATSADSTIQLRLVPSHGYMLKQANASGLIGEEYGAWQADAWELAGSGVTLEAFNTSAGMPGVPRTWTKQGDGVLKATTDAPAWGAFTPTPCKSYVASQYQLPMATLHLPDGLDVTERNDTRDFGTGKPGMFVILEDDRGTDVTALVSVIYADAGAPPMDARAQAVRSGNPMDESLTAADSKPVMIDGVEGAKYDATETRVGVPTRHVGYAIEHHGCRITVEIGGDAQYNALIDKMSATVESMTWKPGASCTLPAQASQ